MKRHLLASVAVAVLLTAAGFAASTAAAATMPSGYYWTSARMTAAFKMVTWSNHSTDGIGLRCEDQGRGACNFTVGCRGLASNPTTTPAPRDVLKVGQSRYRFRYFHCVATSTCILGGSWWHDYRTNTGGPANAATDPRYLWPLSSPTLRANPAGCQ